MKPIKRIGTLAFAACCVLTVSLCATAGPVQIKTPAHKKPDWEDKIIPGSQLTVFELARLIIPDIKSDPGKLDKVTGSDLSGVRVVDGVEETGMELGGDSNDECQITANDYFWMKDGRDRLLVLLLKVDGEGVVIGLFKSSPKITLLDAVTIAQDVHVDVEAGKLWTIHPRHQAFMVQCWHDNSSESYDNYTLISIIDRKLRAVAGPILSSGVATYLPAQERLCKTSSSPKFQFVRSPGQGYFDLIVSETTLKVCHRESDEWSWKTGVVYRRTTRRLWRWSVKRRQYRRLSPGRR